MCFVMFFWLLFLLRTWNQNFFPLLHGKILQWSPYPSKTLSSYQSAAPNSPSVTLLCIPGEFPLHYPTSKPNKTPSSKPASKVVNHLIPNPSSISTMPTKLKEAETRKREEEAMVATTLQWEKEAAAHQRKEEIALITLENSKHSQTAMHKAIDTPSITPSPENPHTLVVSPPSATK